uniref:Uncharacterized protein n=1 Tax=Oryza rufipogon TaxID=4529 RepID=A0A0E0PEI4_ORYRU
MRRRERARWRGGGVSAGLRCCGSTLVWRPSAKRRSTFRDLNKHSRMTFIVMFMENVGAIARENIMRRRIPAGEPASRRYRFSPTAPAFSESRSSPIHTKHLDGSPVVRIVLKLA